jgi:hypothetical protein
MLRLVPVISVQLRLLVDFLRDQKKDPGDREKNTYRAAQSSCLSRPLFFALTLKLGNACAFGFYLALPGAHLLLLSGIVVAVSLSVLVMVIKRHWGQYGKKKPKNQKKPKK